MKWVQRSVMGAGMLMMLIFSQDRDDSWMLYDDSEVAVIHITLDPDAMDWIYEHVESDSMHLAQFSFQNGLIDETVEDVGFRLRGNTSRQAAKKSFKISFNTFVPGRQFYDVEKMNLNGEHNDPSIARSKFNWDWYNRIGKTASRAAHCALYINEEFYGLYISVEHIDDEFLSNHYADDSGNLWKCLWPADLTYRGDDPEDYHPYQDDSRPYELKTNKDEYDYSQLARLIDVINNTPDQLFADSLNQVLVVPEFLTYLATDVLLGNWDDYWFLMNNYYIYHEPSIDRFHWIPYDNDNSMGIDWFSVDWAETNPYSFAIIDGGPRPLVERIMSNADLKNLYTHFLDFYAFNVLAGYNWQEELDQLADQLLPWAELDDYRRLDYGFDADGGIDDFHDSYSLDGYDNQHVKFGLKEFLQRRLETLPTQLNYVATDPAIYQFDYDPLITAETDTIPVSCSVFDENGLTFVQIHSISADGQHDYRSFTFSPVPGTSRVDEADRWIGYLLPPPLGESLQFELLAMDGQGNITTFPPDEMILLTAPAAGYGEVRLNEFLASNDEVIQDEYGEFDDWTEIFNGTAEPVDLAGYYLTDNPDNPVKWQFDADSFSLEPGAFLLVWCDNDDEQGGLHTSFKLDKDGEFIGIVAPDGVTFIDSLTFGEQVTDISMARIPDGSGNWQLLDMPTPGDSNGSSPCTTVGDLNCDQALDVLDIVIMVEWIISGIQLTEDELDLADISGDGALDVIDIVQLVSLILG